jgi:bifunctional DNA-binding transcriptional regulator/antitoxin component of YhaV-PrlF toxin-antitoxin module
MEAAMLIATSRITAQGQISVPAEVRRRMHAGCGTELVWDLRENGDMVVHAKRRTFEDVQAILNGPGLPTIHATDQDLRQARAAFLAGHWKNGPARED